MSEEYLLGVLPQWSYDSKTKYGYLTLSDNVIAYTEETQDSRVLLDMAEDGTIVGIEVCTT